MRKTLIFILLVLFCVCNASSQTNSCEQLLNALNIPAHVIYVQPIKKVRLSKEHISDYYWTMKEDLKNSIDTAIILDIIDNNKSIDTTEWSDSEVKKYLLLGKADLSLSYVIAKLSITDKPQISYYNELIKTLNNSTVCNKGIFRISRPLFDSSKKYAILQYEHLDCLGEGKIGLKLFTDLHSEWTEMGDISSWIIQGTHDVPSIVQ